VREIIIGVRCQIIWRLSLFPIRLFNEFLIPIGPIGSCLVYSKIIGRWQRHEEIFPQPSNVYFMFTEAHWSQLKTF
jgi:hypothetical protein